MRVAVLQPYVSVSQPTNTTVLPPRPIPASRIPRARARLRTNQLATATLMGRPPPKLDAVEMSRNTA